ncbi:MAG: TMEM165/GDT1 family protein, partial [Deltaproteobacteria bacterium]|nr:TMEM165/GDT1 family protein [Deltaproteobacteria bacterium]
MDFKVLLATFGTIFLAELGDKTQIACILMASKPGKPVA